MSLWKIAWRSIQQRTLASLLTTISMALGVMLVVAVLVIYNVVDKAFHRGGEGYDLIVGPAKGSNLELVFSSVFYIGQPMTTLPYRVYRDLAESRIGNGAVKTAVPVCLGDAYQDKRVVGTTSEMFDLTYFGDQKYEFAEGAGFVDNEKEEENRKHYFEAVAGATAAKQIGLKVGSTFRPTHDAGGKTDDKHGSFTVVGVLKPTGTPNDNVLFVNIEGFYRVGGHAGKAGRSLAEQESENKATAKSEAGHETKDAKAEQHHEAHDHDHEAIPDSEKQVSAVLVCTWKESQTRPLALEINKSRDAQAAIPAEEISRLLSLIIGRIEIVLLVFAVMIVIVAGIGIMVSIYNSMNDRRHEIAIMRALGARRSTVMVVILLESILLSLGGGVLGLLLGHGLLLTAGPWIAEMANLPLSMLEFRPAELILIPGLIVLASIVGYLPAVAAYRTDVGKSLIANP
jgi:putative ABC transport system permease protein